MGNGNFEVKRYDCGYRDDAEVDGFIGLKLKDDGELVSYADYAKLEAQVKQLAAENSARKNGNGTAIEFRDFYAWWNIFNDDGLRTEEERMLAAGAWMARSGLGNTDAYQYVAPETPATDTYLSQLRNEARAEVLDVLRRLYDECDSGCRGGYGVQVFVRTPSIEIVEEARLFIKKADRQLREGKAGEVQS